MFEIQLKDGTALFAMKLTRDDAGIHVRGKTVRVVPGPKGGPSLMPWSTKELFVSASLIGLVAELEDDAPHARQVRTMLTGVIQATNLPEDSSPADPGFKLMED